MAEARERPTCPGQPPGAVAGIGCAALLQQVVAAAHGRIEGFAVPRGLEGEHMKRMLPAAPPITSSASSRNLRRNQMAASLQRQAHSRRPGAQ